MHAATAAIAEKNKVPYCGVAFALWQIHQQGYQYLFSPFPKSPNQARDVFEILNASDPRGRAPYQGGDLLRSNRLGQGAGRLVERECCRVWV